jgi:hypothetical protein
MVLSAHGHRIYPINHLSALHPAELKIWVQSRYNLTFEESVISMQPV